MKLLCLNPGSGTLRYRVVETDRCESDSPSPDLERGMVDRIKGKEKVAEEAIKLFRRIGNGSLDAVAIRFVHGGPYWKQRSREIDANVLQAFEEVRHLAPLHVPTAIAVADAIRNETRLKVHAVFDTAFHRTLPKHVWRYPLPYDIGERYRRIGFHGLAHESVFNTWDRESSKVLSLHFGGGASACAILDGKSIWTTMGLTPLDGLMMSSRSGSLDPALVLALLRDGRSIDEVDEMLNRDSGLLGVSGISDDTRDLLPAAATGNSRAELALQMYSARVHECIGAGIAVLGGCDALLLSGALVKESAEFRRRLLGDLQCFGIKLDANRNYRDDELQQPTLLSADDARMPVAFVPAEEELQMARQVIASQAPADVM